MSSKNVIKELFDEFTKGFIEGLTRVVVEDLKIKKKKNVDVYEIWINSEFYDKVRERFENHFDIPEGFTLPVLWNDRLVIIAAGKNEEYVKEHERRHIEFAEKAKISKNIYADSKKFGEYIEKVLDKNLDISERFVAAVNAYMKFWEIQTKERPEVFSLSEAYAYLYSIKGEKGNYAEYLIKESEEKYKLLSSLKQMEDETKYFSNLAKKTYSELLDTLKEKIRFGEKLQLIDTELGREIYPLLIRELETIYEELLEKDVKKAYGTIKIFESIASYYPLETVFLLIALYRLAEKNGLKETMSFVLRVESIEEVYRRYLEEFSQQRNKT